MGPTGRTNDELKENEMIWIAVWLLCLYVLVSLCGIDSRGERKRGIDRGQHPRRRKPGRCGYPKPELWEI